MRVLMIAALMRTSAGSTVGGGVAAQIESIHRAGVDTRVLEIKHEEQAKYLRAIPRMRHYLQSVDVVHAHYGFCGWVARAQTRKPVVVTFMGSDLLGERTTSGKLTRFNTAIVRANQLLARTANATIVMSEQMARIVAPARPHIIPNGVDLQRFQPIDPREARSTLGWAEDRYYILFPGGTHRPVKNFALAQESIRLAAPRVDRPIEVVPLHDIPNDRVPMLMNACQLLLMTSLSEGSPNAVKEAMACNLPVVSVPVGDVPELVRSVEHSVICSRDAAAIADTLVQVLTQGQRSNGREVLRNRALDEENVARQIIAIYEGVLRRAG